MSLTSPSVGVVKHENPFRFALEQVERAQVESEPFPHFILPQLVPEETYAQLLSEIPPLDSYAQADYPGTGYGKSRGVSGRVVTKDRFTGLYAELRDFLESDEFTGALLAKFADAIPSEKHRYFSNGARHYRSAFSLYLDGEGYEIPPHNDTAEKIVTFLWYMTQDDSMAEYGTWLCKPKGKVGRGLLAAAARSPLMLADKLSGGRPHEIWRRIARTTYAFESGFRDGGNWQPWRRFELAKQAEARPNHFLAFAPNDRSWHAVRMEIPEGSEGRYTMRGFIRSGENDGDYVTIR